MQPPKMKYPREQFVGCAVLFCSQTVQAVSSQSSQHRGLWCYARAHSGCYFALWTYQVVKHFKRRQQHPSYNTLLHNLHSTTAVSTGGGNQHFNYLVTENKAKQNHLCFSQQGLYLPTTTINPTTDCRIAGNPFTSELGHFTVNQVSSLILNRYAIQTQIE